MNPETDEVFRDKLSEPRDGYFVEYSPVGTGMAFASLSLVFTSDSPDSVNVQKLMDDELTHWLARFPVPLFVSSFDAKGDVVQVGAYQRPAHAAPRRSGRNARCGLGFSAHGNGGETLPRGASGLPV